MSRIQDGYIVLSSRAFLEFLKGQSKKDTNLKNFYSEPSRMFPSISASKLRVVDEVEIDKLEELDYDIQITDSIFEKGLSIKNGKFKQLWFASCQFQDAVRIYNGSFNSWLWFNGCRFDSNFTVSNGFFNSFHFLANTISGFFLIEGGEFDQVHLSQKDDSQGAIIKGPFTLVNFLLVNGSTLKSKLTISECVINIIKYTGIFNKGSIIVNNDLRLYTLIFDKVVNLGTFHISNTEVLKETYKIKDQTVETLFQRNFVFQKHEEDSVKRSIERNQTKTILDYVNHFSNRSNKFVKTNLDRLIEELFERGGRVYKNIFIEQKTSLFSLYESSIGEIEIKNVDIDSFNEIKIDSTDLSLLRTMNTQFPVKKGRITSTSNNPKNLYHFYNDLYSMSSRQNNLKDKIEYYKASQIYLLETTKTESNSWNKVSSIISIYTSKFYSDYGQNWIKSFVLVFFIIGPIFFGLFIVSMKNIEIDLSPTGISFYFTDILQYYPEFVNPTHKSSFLRETYPYGKLSLFIDLISRIFIGLGIYETIRSFRKYVRK